MGEIVSLYLREPYAGRGLGRARRFYERAGFAAAGEAIECDIGGKTLRELRYVRRGDRNS